MQNGKQHLYIPVSALYFLTGSFVCSEIHNINRNVHLRTAASRIGVLNAS